MKTTRLTILTTVAALAYFADFSPATSPLPFGVQWMSEATAVAGVRRRTARRGVAVGYAAGSSAAAASSSSQQQAATAQQQSETAQQQSQTAQQQAPSAQPAAPGAHVAAEGALALGTVVSALPDGCSETSSGGIEYYHCGENYFRAAFQGNNLVYVTAIPQGS